MFRNRSDGELWVRCYLISPDTIDTIERAVYWGNSAAEHIRECEAMVERLKEYQQLIYKRVQELATAPYHHRVSLIRERRFRESKVFYYLIVEKVYDAEGIRPVEISRANWAGRDRLEALKAFEDYKRSHPGIEAVKDIDRAAWER